MAILATIGKFLLVAVIVCVWIAGNYWKAKQAEDHRKHKSGLQGLFKKID